MNENIYFLRFTNDNKRKLKLLEEFLHSIDLKNSPDIEEYVIAKDDTDIVACGGIAKNVLKCIGISPKLRGQGFVLPLMTELLNLAYEKGRDELFLYSKPRNKEFFQGCGFKLIEEVKDEIVLMQNSSNLETYKKNLLKQKKPFPKVGSIVMNANPFTLGHRYLAKKASKLCDWLHIFVVKEDASDFSFDDRFKLIQEGLSDIENITIHEGSEYIISRATFPTYFLKESQNVDSIYSKLDIQIFKHHIAPSLGITHRFVGEEPHCVVTNDYNLQMKNILSKDDGYPKIKVEIISRHEIDDVIVSASTVRESLKNGNLDDVKKLVPKSTYEFLKNIKLKEQGA